MDAIRNMPELLMEFVTRRDYIGVWLIGVSLWLFWLGFRGLTMGNTMSFGWRAGQATGDTALTVGRAWLGIAVALMASGIGLWVTD